MYFSMTAFPFPFPLFSMSLPCNVVKPQVDLAYLVGLVVEDDEVAVTHVEAGQMVTRVLGIKDVFVHHKGRSLSLRRVTPVKT